MKQTLKQQDKIYFEVKLLKISKFYSNSDPYMSLLCINTHCDWIILMCRYTALTSAYYIVYNVLLS